MFRRANTVQQVIVVLCGIVALHGIYVLFVPGVQLANSALPCPPAIVAALAGSGGVSVGDVTPEIAGSHDAACASTGRLYTAAALLQVGIAVVWGLATLEWARVWRRVGRRKRREGRHAERGTGDGGT